MLLSRVFGSQAPGILLAMTPMGWNEDREELAQHRAGRQVRSQLLPAAIAGQRHKAPRAALGTCEGWGPRQRSAWPAGVGGRRAEPRAGQKGPHLSQ